MDDSHQFQRHDKQRLEDVCCYQGQEKKVGSCMDACVRVERSEDQTVAYECYCDGQGDDQYSSGCENNAFHFSRVYRG